MRFLKLASTWLDKKDDDPFTWPYWVDVSVGDGPTKVAFAEGVAHGSAGGMFPIEEFVMPKWHKHVVAAEAEWLLPYVRRIIAGEGVTEQELSDAFFDRHAREPESYDWNY